MTRLCAFTVTSAMSHAVLTPLSAAGLAVVGLSGLPGLFAILAQIRNRTPKDNFYEDIDGKATPESIAAFSNTRPKVAILTLSVLGLGLSVAISVLDTLHPTYDGMLLPNWLFTGTWVSSN